MREKKEGCEREEGKERGERDIPERGEEDKTQAPLVEGGAWE